MRIIGNDPSVPRQEHAVASGTLTNGAPVIVNSDGTVSVVGMIETTGAGDAFNGGFAHALASGQSLRDSIRFGSATAALSVTKPGTAPAMPSSTDIQSLLKVETLS